MRCALAFRVHMATNRLKSLMYMLSTSPLG
jgi:hypothetical protein